MITGAFTDALRIIVSRLQGSRVRWAVTGSLGFALHGVPVTVNDIDIQTDRDGAYEIERLLNEFVHQAVTFSTSDRIRSHFGSLLIKEVVVEIMGDVEKRLDDDSWQAAPDLDVHRRLVDFRGMVVPVMSLEYEYQAYRILGRTEKMRILEEWLSARGTQDHDAGE